MTTTEENGFLSALARFEKWLETPVVPGELPTWLSSARKSCDEAGELLRTEISEKHGQMLTAMFAQDPELGPRVEELRTGGEKLLTQYNDVHSTLDRLCEMADQAEPHERKLDEHIESFTKDALAFVIEARMQDNALTTWYMEAFTRDRGIAD